MAVNTVAGYIKVFHDRWERCRDVFAGGDAVKSKGQKYLPMLPAHAITTPGSTAVHVGYKGGAVLSSAYTGYLDRALFYPAGSRTVLGLTGLVFAHPLSVANVPKPDRPQFDDVTLEGVSLAAFAVDMCQELLVVGRGGVLIDMPRDARPGARPFWVRYRAEQIVNTRVTCINGVNVLTLLVLEESAEVAGEDEFETKTIQQWRVLRLVDGVYTSEVWREDASKSGSFIIHEERVTPTRKGATLDSIPFVFFGATGVTSKVDKPPLLDLFDVNLSHYRTSADHEHGAHFTALPQPWIAGYNAVEGEVMTLGSGSVWTFSSDKASCGMLEFSGAGLDSLAKLKEEKRQQMVTLGARMLESQKNTPEAAETVRMRHAGDASALSVLAENLGLALTLAVRWHLFWLGLAPAVSSRASVTINPDVLGSLSAEDVKTLLLTWQAGGISKRTFYDNLVWGEWARTGVTFEEEEAEIARETPDIPTIDPLQE